MNYSLEQLDVIFNKYINFVDNLKYNYSDKIKNLLYLIIPGFIIRYGINNEKIILDAVNNILINISNSSTKSIKAYYTCIPKYKDDKIITSKNITISDFNNLDMISLLDSLIHEFNHAVNSYNNNLNYDDNYVYIRTGLCNFIYSRDSLNFIKKDKAYILEEVLNTKQTEEIINIIHSFKKYKFKNPKINTAIYILDNHINKSYVSESYQIENLFLKELISNKTFISTLSNLRLKGEIKYIADWFDDITGIKNSYNELIDILYKLSNVESKTFKFKFMEKRWRRNISSLYQRELEIINIFNKNCNFK